MPVEKQAPVQTLTVENTPEVWIGTEEIALLISAEPEHLAEVEYLQTGALTPDSVIVRAKAP